MSAHDRDWPAGAARRLVNALIELQTSAGKPSIRSVAQAIGTSHSTVAEALRGKRIPSWSILEGIVSYFDGDKESFRRLWEEAQYEASRENSLTDSDRDYISLYRNRLISIYDKMTLPDYWKRHVVSANVMLINPLIKEWATNRPVDLPKFADKIRRTVLLGQPGTGKSTLARAITVREVRKKTRSVPFIVNIREFASRGKPVSSVVRYIEDALETLFQTRPPSGLISRLLARGEALIIFDGLDEILNSANRGLVAEVIELFAYQFPAARILVTSRSIGYSQAQLDPSVFDIFELSRFNVEQVSQYVHNWFAEVEGLPEESARAMAIKFMKETEQLEDLRSSPLFLGVLCVQFARTGLIPRDRLEILESYTELFIERWDKMRGIELLEFSSRRIERLLEEIALRLDKDSVHVISQTELVSLIEQVDFDIHGSGDGSAEVLVNFMTGRAWLFNEVGAKPTGEPVYSFTHRSLFEYFVARGLVRTTKSTGGLAMEILKRATRDLGNLEVLAVQIVDRARHSAGHEVLSILAAGIQGLVDEREIRNVIDFIWLAAKADASLGRSAPMMENLLRETREPRN